jgi:hypothetical protein
MRVDIFIEIFSVEKALRFYQDELKMFTYCHDFGSGSMLLKYVNENVCISTILKKENILRANLNAFGLQVKNCKLTYENLKKVNFTDGAGITPFPNGAEIIESPLGILFYVKDPFGNEFSIFEDFYNFVDNQNINDNSLK